MADAHAWAAEPAPRAPRPDTPATTERLVADVGAETFCKHVGTDYDAMDAVTRSHVQGAAWAAFLAMWNVAVEHDLTVAAEHVSEDGQPLTRSEPTP